MYVRALFAALLVLLCTPGIQEGALAQNITVVIQGTTVAGPVPSLNIAGSYPSVTNTDFVITNYPGGVAQVTVDDTSIDTLWLKNTVIEAKKANVSGTIEFSYQYVPGPTAPASAPPTVRYETSVTGFFTPIVLNNQITLWGSIKNPPTDPAWQDITPAHYKKITCTGSGCGNINPNSAVFYRDWNPFSQDRIIKGKITFFLKNVGNKIHLPNGMRVSSTEAGGGGPDECEPGVRPVHFWSSFSWTTEIFKCWHSEKQAATSTNHERAYKFAKATWGNLSQDLARGNGEFVNSLATLMEVPIDSRSAFASVAQDQYRLLAKTASLSPDTMVDQLWTSLIRNHRE